MNAITRNRLGRIRTALERLDMLTEDSRSREDDKAIYDAFGALSGLEDGLGRAVYPVSGVA